MRKICIISPDGDYAAVIGNTLEHANHEVCCYLAQPDIESLNPDVVIQEVNPANIRDIQTLAQIKRKLNHKTFIVALLSSTNKTLGRDCIHLGADYFYIKGDSLKNLTLKIDAFEK